MVEAGEAKVDLGVGRFAVAAVTGRSPVPSRWSTAPRSWSGVRPEHLAIDGGGPVEATVTAVEWLGHERHIICDVAGTTVILRQPSEGEAPALGQAVRLGARPERGAPVRPGHHRAPQLTWP